MPTRLTRAAHLASAVALLGLAGCSLDTGDPSTPSSIVGAVAATQTAKTGAGVKISAFILNQFGEPLNGVPVTFALANGLGTLAATSGTTASTGLVETTYTPSKAGTSTVNVSVAGLRALVFTVIAAD